MTPHIPYQRPTLAEQYQQLLALYGRARVERKIDEASAHTIEQQLARIRAALDRMDNGSASTAMLGDRSAENVSTIRLQRMREEFEKIITLYAAAVCRDKIPAEYITLLNQKLAAYATILLLSFTALYDAAIQECSPDAINISVEQSLDAQESAAPALTAQELVGAPLPFEEYGRLMHDEAYRWKREEYENNLRTSKLTLREIEKKPESYAHSKKQWLKENSVKIQGAKDKIEYWEKKVRAFRDGSPDKEDTEFIDRQVHDLWEKSGGRLERGVRDKRLRELLTIVFQEDNAKEQFFPTPSSVVENYVIPNAELEPGMDVLEPSAGKGNIADAVRLACPECTIDVIEINDIRAEVLQLKGYNLVGRDTLAYSGKQYDRILMNPPFNKGMGVKHVIYCFDNLLKPGGRLVAVLNSGAYRNSNDLQSFSFSKNYVDAYGKAIGIPNEEYNKGIERAITIDIGVIVMDKPLVDDRPVETDIDVEIGARVRNLATQSIWTVESINPSSGAIMLRNERTTETAEHSRLTTGRWQTVDADNEEQIALPTRGRVDPGFRTPSVIIARKELTGTARAFHLDQSFLSPKIIEHAIEGANYAIESLSATGGFLLADGTGIGKTVEHLLVALYWYLKTGKPALIFTKSDQIIQQSFFGDARKLLGLATPDVFDTTTRVAQRPKGYNRLYDGSEELYDEAPRLADSQVNVVRFRPDLGVVDGINIGTYNDLSNLRALKDSPLERAVATAKVARDEAKKKYGAKRAAIRKQKGVPKAVKEDQIAAINEEQDLDPAITGMFKAQDAWYEEQRAIIKQWTEAISFLGYDEAHDLKNTGPGGSYRAERAEMLSEMAPRCMFVTATPADKPGDIQYLKRSGLYQSKQQFFELMVDAGHHWVAERRNKNGEIVQRGEFKPSTKFPAMHAVRALGRAFDRLTEDRQMLKRDIELANLEPPQMIDVPIDNSVHLLMGKIEETLTDEARIEDRPAPMAQILMEKKRALEPFKINDCIEIARRELLEGRSVVIFADLVEEGEEPKPWGDPKAGTIRILKDRLSKIVGEDQIGLVIGVQGEYERQQRLQHIQAFQAGHKRVMLCTLGSGGTGISLDDTVGDAPRTIIIMTAPMNSLTAVQLMGRVVRANTKSRSRVYFLFCKIAVDTWLKKIIATKLAMLGAVVKGQTELLSPKELEVIESGGDGAAIDAFLDSQGTAKRHSLFDRKPGIWLVGLDYPQHKPLRVGRFTGNWVRNERDTIRVKGETRGDILRLAEEQAEAFAKYGFVKKSERFEGTYFECPYSDEVWTWALNLITLEQDGVVADPRQIFSVGDPVIALWDIPLAGTAAGTHGRIEKVRPRDGYWLYDVSFENGRLGTSVRQEALGSAKPLHDFRIGQHFTGTKTLTDYYLDTTFTLRIGLEILSIQPGPYFEVEVTLEWQSREGSTWEKYTPPTNYSIFFNHAKLLFPATGRHERYALEQVEGLIDEHRLICDINCVTDESLGLPTRGEPPSKDERPERLHDATNTTTPRQHLSDSRETGVTAPAADVHAAADAITRHDPFASYGHDWLTLNPIERPAHNIADIADLYVERRSLSPRFQALFGRVPESCIFFVHGPAGHGKSSLALQFADEIAWQDESKGKSVLYINAEQRSDRGGMTDRIRNNHVRSRNIDVVDTRDLQAIRQHVTSGRYSFVVIDSISRIMGTDKEKIDGMLSLYRDNPDVSFMLIAHEDKAAKTYKGASDFAHDAEIWVRVECGVASTEKNHFGPHNSVRIIEWKGKT